MIKHLAAAAVASSVLVSATLSWAAGAQNHVRDVKVRAVEAGATEVEVVGTAAPVFHVSVVDAGRTLHVDISNADLARQAPAITDRRGVVGGVRTQHFATTNGSMTRLTIHLAKDATYRVRTEGTTLKISLRPEAEKKPAAPAEATADAPATPAAKAPAAPGSLAIEDVRFERKKSCTAGCDRVVVDLDATIPYSLRTTSEGKVRLELAKAKLPEKLARTLDVSAYRGALRAVTTFRDPASGAVVVEIERDGNDRGTVTREGGSLIWAFDGVGRPTGRRAVTVAREQSEADLPRVTQSIHDGEEDEGGEPGAVVVESTDGARAAGFASTVRAQAAGRYRGRRIDLDLKDADVHNVLRLLADVGKVNIVTADDVAGNITIRMRNVPWDQALDVVLQAKGLGMVRQGNLIRVAPLAQLQKERELRLAAAKQEYELTPLETRLIPVSYAQAQELQARAKDLLSPRGSIAVDERTNVLIARDIAGNLNNIEELVRSLDTQTPEVLVEARIVEATSRYLRDIGIQWGGDATFSEATGNPTGVAFPSKVSMSGGNYDNQTPTAGLSPFQRQVPQPNFAVNLPAAVGTGQGGALGFALGSVDNNFNLGVRLSAAQATGLLRIVSSPRILTLDNRDARISQGTLIPFAQISAQGVQTTFQEAKLQLLVRPHVTAEGSIAMHVKINRDEPDFNQTSPRGDPTILKREAETDLLVMDGHTAVIGGIYTRNTGRNLDQIPFFGDIPILGVLFQRRRASDTRNELVIFLTPRIVNRAEALGR